MVSVIRGCDVQRIEGVPGCLADAALGCAGKILQDNRTAARCFPFLYLHRIECFDFLMTSGNTPNQYSEAGEPLVCVSEETGARMESLMSASSDSACR